MAQGLLKIVLRVNRKNSLGLISLKCFLPDGAQKFASLVLFLSCSETVFICYFDNKIYGRRDVKYISGNWSV